MTIITAAEVQKGDLIRVTTVDVDRTNSFQGIADHIKPSTSGRVAFRWFTADDWTLWTSAIGAVIELLDRPKPKIELPTGKHAVIQYHRGSTLWTARFDGNDWHLSGNGFDWGLTYNPRTLADMLNEHKNSNPRTDFKVLFEGVAK